MTQQIDIPAVDVKRCGCPESQAISRRSFLKRSAAAGVVAGLAAEGMFTRLAFAATPYTGDVLVVLSLRGGMDGLSAIVPSGDPAYLVQRPGIGLQSPQLLQLDSMFGMHEAMGSLKPFFDAGTFGVIHAVGMEEPNRSHFAAMEEMERAAPGSSTRTGWLDRVLGLREETSAFQGTQIGYSSSSQQFVGPSAELAMYSINGFDLSGAYNDTERVKWDAALRSLHQGAPTMVGQPAGTALDALATAAALQAAGYTPANGASYPGTGLGNALKDIARLIKADVGLQVAAIDYGDWDMHSDLGSHASGEWMYDHLTELSNAMSAFATDLGAGLDDVTLVTLTEFGRRVEENGSAGVDHGYGQAVMLLGGGVDGGKVHIPKGWPGLSNADLVDGDLDGRHDYRAVLAELLEKRCQASASDVKDIFPKLTTERYGVALQKT